MDAKPTDMEGQLYVMFMESLGNACHKFSTDVTLDGIKSDFESGLSPPSLSPHLSNSELSSHKG
jgi:hypothetical protein